MTSMGNRSGDSSELRQHATPVVVAIDDDPLILLATAKALVSGGMICHTAVTGEAGLRLIREREPDLVLLDILLPGEDGFTICQEIRRTWSPEELPVIMVTGLEDLKSIKAAYESGANDFLTKPLHWTHLPYRIWHVLQANREIIEHKRSEEALRQSQESFASLFEHAVLGLYRTSPEGQILMANQALCDIFGYDSCEDLAQCNLENNPTYDIAGFREELAEKSRVTGFESIWTRPNGKTVMVRENARAVHDVAGNLMYFEGIVEDITERKRSEEALLTSEKKFTKIFQMSPDAIDLTRTSDGVSLALNNSYTKLYGYTPEEFIGHSTLPGDLGCWVNQEDRDRHIAILKEHGEVLGFETLARRKDGSNFIAQISSSVIEIDGEAYNLSITRDITERQALQEELEKNKNLLRQVLDTLPIPVYCKDQEERYSLTNRTFQKFMGLTEQDFLGKTSFDISPPLLRELYRQSDRLLLETGKTLQYETMVEAAIGLRKIVVTKNVMRNPSGELIGLVGAFLDITERKLAEEKLRESEEEYRQLVWDMQVGVLLQGPQAEILLSNPKALELLGLSEDQLLGKTSFDPEWNVIHEDGSPFPGSTHPVPQAIASRHPVREIVMGVYRPTTGNRVWLSVDAETQLSEDGTVRQVVCTFIDITERKQAEEEKVKLQAQLQQAQKMESLGILAGGVAHDMNNVLGAILGMASANIDAQAEGSPAYRAFDTISKAAVRGGKMVKSLLSFARQSPADERELDMNAILREEVRMLERTTLSKIRLEMDLESELRLIRGDASALTHAFMNLCVNAVDAMPDRGTLTLRSRNVDNDWIEVMVEDTGTGMPKEILEKAMDPFFTTKAVGKGTGLGLSMVYSTVKAHKGQLEIKSVPGQGTRVRLRFPSCEVAAHAIESATEPRFEFTHGKLTVLLVDDDAMIQSSLLELLAVLGHNATGVYSGEEALAKLETGLNPDVVMLDMNMPGLGGSGTLPRLRALRPTLPVLLATGRVDQAALNLIEAYPFVTLLSKPFSMEELQQHFERIGRS